MGITYDGKRKDITFCTMLFKIPTPASFDSLKGMNRKFENFYLPSLKKMIQTFKKVAIWCDKETSDFIKKEKLDAYVDMHVMDFSELPHYKEKSEWLDILHGMRASKYVGFLFHHKTPEQWINYLILINAKPAVMDWAATSNKFNTKYFMWIDAGSFHPMYEGFWTDWTGHILAKPNRVRITISPTLGKTRPPFVPNFIYRIYRKCKGKIPDATRETLSKQNLVEIAMINADYDVPACSMMADADWTHKFYNQYENVRKIMKNHKLVGTEQAVFQAMMKFDTCNMFELSYVRGYAGVYAGVAKEKPDYLL